MTESGVKDCELLFLMSPTISCAERSGRACRRQAVSPAIIGAENEVPSFHAVFPSGVIIQEYNVSENSETPLYTLKKGIYILAARCQSNYWTQKIQRL